MVSLAEFSAIGSDINLGDAADDSRARREREAFGGSASSDIPEDEYRNRYEKSLYDAHIEHLGQIRELKKQYSKYVLLYLAIFSSACLALLLAVGANLKFDFSVGHPGGFHFRCRLGGFHLDDMPLTTLIGSTAVSAIGLVLVVLKGLFQSVSVADAKPKRPKNDSRTAV